ncbi:MAG: DUF2993 domain-containing protein [Cyanobacteriota bacterium]|nr:DUF2993 domain-containing protein [Cyanobacteriota bacterium]
MSDEEPRLDEQALAQIAEVGIASQLDSTEKLEVNIQSDLSQISQGKVDFVSVIGEGLVVKQDIRVQEFELQARGIAVDWLKAVFGDIKLEQPASAAVRAVMQEADLNRAINSDFIRRKFPVFPLQLEGRLIKIQLKQIVLQLCPNNRIVCHGDVLLQDCEKLQDLRFTASLRSRTDKQPILLEGFSCKNSDAISLEIAYAFVKKAREFSTAQYWELEGIKFKIEKMVVREREIEIEVTAYISQLPSF